MRSGPPSAPAGRAALAPIRYRAPAALLRALPHLPAFFPEATAIEPARRWHRQAPSEPLPPLLLPAASPWRAGRAGRGGGTGAAPACVLLDAGPWQAPRFGRRHAPVALLAVPAPGAAADPLALVLAEGLGAPAASLAAWAALRADAAQAMALLAEARIGGPTGLPDPGPESGLGCGRREAVLVLDPCRADRAPAAAAMHRVAAAEALAIGRPLRVVRSPGAPPTARPTLPGCLPAPLAPWTLLDAAAVLHLLDDPLGLLALAAGVPVACHDPAAPFAGWGATRDAPQVPRRPGPARDATDLFAALVAATRCADPFRSRPWTLAEALRQLADWRVVEAENRRIVVCCGMAFWKRRRIAAAFASEAGTPAFRNGVRAAVAAARRRGDAGATLAVWATRVPRGLSERAAAAGLGVAYVEDGFIRSAGLGAGFLPGASLVLDAAPGLHLDPAAPSRLERLLAGTRFDPALLTRAAALRAALLERGVTKYNLGGAAAAPFALGAPPGARRILVPGQVEDDLSVRLGAAPGGVRSNLDLLRAAREAAGPDAFLVFKPHPDVEAGFRRGRVPLREALRFADRVVCDAPMTALLAAVDEVHTLTSLTGFEALLRGLRVVCWGTPFYAGWGLTEDRAPVPSRRHGYDLTIDELVAACLILYPRYVDPVTELPCPVEVVLDRLADPTPWRPGLIARLRRWQGRAQAALRRWTEGA
ncbi:hypothetical protein GCM10010964_22710 [Caldovatus sediminis]|uniref:Uncharacterized protein n=1 Tax=Caldovatus sediminis TaxID=2041189 RepID=A0A8J3EB76_9PROT|nr:beta-3-deoxy-D-manno-oct-2-ulosonic acid transferase [Caldovatus sediminis]GGG34239.1 hypothetical protein GCM10010964_22710 [Caldovatus sediminis]